jgi:hypothetical protein
LYPSCRKKGFETLASSAVVLKEEKPTIERGKHRKTPNRFVPNDHPTSLGPHVEAEFLHGFASPDWGAEYY